MSGRIPTECHRPTVSSTVSYFLFCVLVFSERGDESAFSYARDPLFHLCRDRFVDSFLCDETVFQVVSDCAVMRKVWLTLPRHFPYLVSMFRRALPIGESWNRAYSISSRPMTPSGMRPISFGVLGPDPTLSATLGSVDAILVAVYLGGRVWRRFYGPLGPERSLDRWAMFCVFTINCITLDLFLWVGGLDPLVFVCGNNLSMV